MNVLLGLIVLAATLTVWWRMPESRELLRHRQLALPFVATWLVEWVVGAIAVAAIWLQEPLVSRMAAVGLGVSGLALVLFVVGVLEAAWVSPLLLHVVRGESLTGALLPARRQAPDRCLRMAVAVVLGNAAMLPLAVLFLGAASSLPIEAATTIGAFFAIGLGSLWSALSGSWVFEVLARGTPLVAALQRGIRLGFLSLSNWLPLVFCQAIVVGQVVVSPANTTCSFGWLGGYCRGSGWLGDGSSDVPWILFALLQLALTVATLLLALSIKLRIAASVVRRDRQLAETTS
jgi:hypothetical protein